MTLRDAYSILDLPDSASLDQIKSAYRKLAFKLHPDLNPDDRNASKKFQQLNEAYVLLKDTAASGGAQKAASGGHGRYDKAGRAQRGARSKGSRQKPEPEPRKKTARERKETWSTGPAKGKAKPKKEQSNFYFKKEEVLHDILKDPFARKVFEDIYAQVRQQQGSKGAPVGKKTLRKRNLDLSWGNKKMSLDVSKGFFGGIKGWMRRQLDDQQTIHLPAANLVPGRKVRIKIQQGISGEEKSVEITLPPDFIIGRPIRLRNLGRRLGPFTGDMYLRILGK